MTNREFYEAITKNENVADELKEFAQTAIEKLDETNAKRKAKAAEKKSEDQKYIDMLVGFLGDTPVTATELLTKFAEAEVTTIGGKTVTVQKISSMARKAVAQESAVAADIKVTGKGTCKGYTVA